jgi:hypothetical protein
LLEISEEVTKMHGAITMPQKSPVNEVPTSGVMDTHETKTVLTKLQHVNTSIHQYKRLVLSDYSERFYNSVLLINHLDMVDFCSEEKLLML